MLWMAFHEMLNLYLSTTIHRHPRIPMQWRGLWVNVGQWWLQTGWHAHLPNMCFVELHVLQDDWFLWLRHSCLLIATRGRFECAAMHKKVLYKYNISPFTAFPFLFLCHYRRLGPHNPGSPVLFACSALAFAHSTMFENTSNLINLCVYMLLPFRGTHNMRCFPALIEPSPCSEASHQYCKFCCLIGPDEFHLKQERNFGWVWYFIPLTVHHW